MKIESRISCLSKSIIGIILFIFCGSLVISCTSKPIAPGMAVQRFDSQAYYQDKETGKSQQVTLEVVAKKNQKMRVDVKVVLGLHIATAVITNTKLQVALHAEKQYFEGPANPQTLRKTLGIPFYPLILQAMLYREAFRGSGWNCAVRNGKVVKCLQRPTGMTITWEDQGDATMVTANTKTFNLQWRILPPENVEEKPSYFDVKIPDSYTRMNL